jgi:hypothetical protein
MYELLIVKSGGIYSYQWALKGYNHQEGSVIRQITYSVHPRYKTQ